MEGALPIIFLAVILKIPVFFGLWLVWWAVRAEPEIDDAPGSEQDHRFRRWRREPGGPRSPRRGPHGGAATAEPGCNGRVRDALRAGGAGAVPAALPRGSRRNRDRTRAPSG
jgi:hypothetical protein